MTQIKLCGLTKECDVMWANELQPNYVGFVFAKKSRRYVNYYKAEELKALLNPEIKAVGVFVDEDPKMITTLVRLGTIDVIQLHGQEDEAYVKKLRSLTDAPVIQAFKPEDETDLLKARKSSADYVLLDGGAGDGKAFNWEILSKMDRPFFLAGGLTADNLEEAMDCVQPFGVDASSSLETDGVKDREKMAAFVRAVREKEREHGR